MTRGTVFENITGGSVREMHTSLAKELSGNAVCVGLSERTGGHGDDEIACK